MLTVYCAIPENIHTLSTKEIPQGSGVKPKQRKIHNKINWNFQRKYYTQS